MGPDVDLMADTNCRYTAAEAVAMAKVLEEHGFVWLEEPVPPEDVQGYRAVKAQTRLAVAGGECECGHYRFGPLLAQGVFDVVKPDICRAGGLAACQRIGVLADAFNVRIAPHVSLGSAVHVAASLHWAVAARRVWIHELPVFRNPLVDDLLVEPLQWQEGHLEVPSGPGLGVELRQDVVERYRTK